MKLTFLGADHEVTGSCTLLEVGGKSAFIDCGMEQGRNVYQNAPSPVPADKLDYVFLTHAHIDHSGNLPLLYKNGFRGAIYATKETCALCVIMLKDSAHIQESEAEYKSRKAERAGLPSIQPEYTLEDVEGVMKLFRPCEYGSQIQIDEAVFVRYIDIGHLLGSACIEFWLKEDSAEKKLVFSGDVGNTNQPIIRDPQKVEEADYLVIESTYGNRLHGERAGHVEALADCIQRTLDRKGNLVIPAFAVGRTQEMLYFIREIKNSGMVKGHDGFKVYVDSPLANEATSVFMQCDTKCLDDETRAVMARGENPIVFDGLITYVTTEDSKALNDDPEPKVIIASSGMCEAGRIRHHLKHNLWRSECTVLFVGFQAEGTLGRALQDGAKKVKLFGEDIAVNAEIAVFPGISGHADKQGLLDWVSGFKKKPKKVFVNHGDEDSCTEFARCLREEHGMDAEAPYSGTVFDLEKGEYILKTNGVLVEHEEKRAPLGSAIERLIHAAKKLLDAAHRSHGLPNRELAGYADQIERIAEKIGK